MGRRFYEERYDRDVTAKYYYGNPCRWFKQYCNRIDRRNLNHAVRSEEPEIPKRWSHRHWGLWKWF
jgi:hypothetical protein